MKKRILTSLLAVSLCFFSLCNSLAYAEEPATEISPSEQSTPAAEEQEASFCPLQVVDLSLTTNSANGVSLRLWFNIRGDKTVKYIYITVTPFNAVDDPVTCEISGESTKTGRITGPLNPESSYSWIDTDQCIYPAWDVWQDSDDSYYRTSGTLGLGPRIYLTEEEVYNSFYRYDYTFENMWYNSTVEKIRIDRIVIQYMDDTQDIFTGEDTKNAFTSVKETYLSRILMSY